MSLSVIIPCRDDPAVVACVGSIDRDAEVVIVLNGSPPGFREDLERRLDDRVRLEVLAHANRSHAADHGINAASHDRVVLMDSDCVFTAGSLTAVEQAFDAGDPDDEVYRGEIVFERGPTRWTRLVARSRARRMGARLCAYKPPLALSRRLKPRLGGYFFDQRLPWREDADLDQRVRRAGIGIVGLPQCRIIHGPLSPRADLRASFLYGVGEAVARHLEVPTLPPNRSWRRSLRRDGIEAAAYLIALNATRSAGLSYARARLALSRGGWLDHLIQT